jgi:hypothetical protein
MEESTKEKVQYLERRSWQRVEPQLDWNYLVNLGTGEIIDSSGQFVAELLEAMRDNPFGWFGSKGKQARRELIEKLCPLSVLPSVPLAVPHIEAQLPPSNYYSEVENAFELLAMTIIDVARRKLLGAPIYLGQQIDQTVVIHTQPERFDWNDSDIKGEFVAQWTQAQLHISKDIHWQSNGTAIVQTWQLYSHQLRQIATAAMTDIGIEINGRAYQVGKLCPEYSLEQFPSYIQEISDKLRFYLVDNGPVARYNILIQGPPGTGKTRWAQSFAAQVLSPQGYLVAVLDYESLENFHLPDYVDKVCVILNDADNLCLDRENAEPGTTEKILAWLDGSRAGYIQPLYLPARSSIVTILTANSTERWDSAGLRQGRIHAQFTFDQILAR